MRLLPPCLHHRQYHEAGASLIEYAIALALVGLVIIAAVFSMTKSASERAATSKSAIDGSHGMVACDPNSTILNMDPGSLECY